jgi:site-specific recombinase XerC
MRVLWKGITAKPAKNCDKAQLFAALLGSGLRVSEMLNLEQDQYTGKGFTQVQIKGGIIRKFVPVHRDARQVLEEWLKERQDAPPAPL